MKPLLLVVLGCLTLTAAPPDAKTQKEITAALDGWKQALLQRDGAALDKLFAPDLVYTHSNDRVETKVQAIEAIVKGPTRYESIEIVEPSIRVYGNTVVVKARITMRVVRPTETVNLPLDVLHVFVKNPAGWQLVARHSILIP